MKEIIIKVSDLGHGKESPVDPSSLSGVIPGSSDKSAVAEHFLTCERTIEDWHAKGLIVGNRRGRAVCFDLSDCESRLAQLVSDASHHQPITASPQELVTQTGLLKEFATTAGLALRYKVSTRTVKNWKRMGLLSFIQVRRVLRFDVQECDASLHKYGFQI
jgi:hypothetical protein